MEKTGIDLLASMANDQPRKRDKEKLKFNEIPLEQVAVVDRPHTALIAQVMLQYGDEHTKWMIEVLNTKPYNKIIVSYPAGYVFLAREHLLPILNQDPGKREYPPVEYIEELWSEPFQNKVNLVCKVLKKPATVASPPLIEETTEHNNDEKLKPNIRRQVFDQNGVYVEQQHTSKKRKAEHV
jgi:hypothetical protein